MATDPADFLPFPLLRGPHLQTIAAAKLALWRREPPGEVEVVSLPDGDRIALVVSTPPSWRPDDRSVLLLHGLCGCHQSSYMMRLALKLWRRGIRAIRMNMRGCGAGASLARQPYHSGRSPDVLTVLEHVRRQWPQSPVTLLGFSLGGNVMLKFAGEQGQRAQQLCTQVIAVCPPADLAACSRLLSQPSNWLYERYFMRRLLAAVAERHRLFPTWRPCACLATCRSTSSTTSTPRHNAASPTPMTTTHAAAPRLGCRVSPCPAGFCSPRTTRLSTPRSSTPSPCPRTSRSCARRGAGTWVSWGVRAALAATTGWMRVCWIGLAGVGRTSRPAA